MWIELPDGEKISWDGEVLPDFFLLYDNTFPYADGIYSTPAQVHCEASCDNKRLEALNELISETLELLLPVGGSLRKAGVKMQPRLRRLLREVMEYARLDEDGELIRDQYVDLRAFGSYINAVCTCSPTYIGSTGGEDEPSMPGCVSGYCLHWDRDPGTAAERFNAEIDKDLKTMDEIKRKLAI